MKNGSKFLGIRNMEQVNVLASWEESELINDFLDEFLPWTKKYQNRLV